MPLDLQIIDELALAGANIALDAEHYDLKALFTALMKLQSKGTGSITIRNAGLLSPNNLRTIATALGGRVTFKD